MARAHRASELGLALVDGTEWLRGRSHSVPFRALSHLEFPSKICDTLKHKAEVVKLAIHVALKMLWPQGRVGSTPTFGTLKYVSP
jgi:hypothetical protein